MMGSLHQNTEQIEICDTQLCLIQKIDDAPGIAMP